MLFKNCRYIITQNTKREILENTDIRVEGDLIVEIGNLSVRNGEEVIDCSERAVLPGLINTHTHIGMHSLRGVEDDLQLKPWLDKVIPIELNQSFDKIRRFAALACREMILSGTTTFCEMYSPIEPIIPAVKESGIRAVLLPSFSDSLPHIKTSLKDMKNFRNTSLMTFGIGPHAIYSCSERFLKELKEYASKNGLLTAIHLAETRRERYDCYQKHGLLPVEYLESIGFLDKNTLLVHAIWITKGEIEILKKRGVKVSHNPVSNMKLASGGTMPLTEMNGIAAGLGTDSVASNNSMDLFEEMKVCGLLHKYHRWDASAAPIQKIIDMATIDGAKCLGMENFIGSIELGKKADIITVDLSVPKMQPVNNILSNIIYSANGNDVREVCINGVLVKR